MVKLYARIYYDHHAGVVTRTAHQWVETKAETWKATVTVALDRNGACRITLSNKHGRNPRLLWSGNTNETAEARCLMAYCSNCDTTTTVEDGQCIECGWNVSTEEATA